MKKTVLFKAGLASLSALMMLAQPTFANDTIHFSNCTEAWENGYSDIHRGEPGYSSRLDKDGDGVACERSKAPRGVFKPRQSHSQSSRTTSGWVNRDGAWYYLKSDGSYVTNSWQGNYYLKSDGKMAKNEWVDGGRYFVGSDGLWQNHSVSQSSSNQTKTDYTNALEKAKNYNSWANMSKKRLYKQLTS